VTVYDYEPGAGPVVPVCPDENCTNTEDLWVQECAPGRTWAFSSSVCGHWGFIHKKSDDA
jgi:hypothetical protein